ncbi:TRANSPARENT TESTA 7, CYTOCHROME P450 75B1 [Hibiscus trionum]|uniref:TRANSPARENT TESTA 7, CYTOCHROME P450 75B1 n=1 Tax=Hibiscus trionum TaxID=183268 RepID=A0A9W7MS57_HIBTR|nr:TRANSPARENT TESTA 7, CYTOCHROME P450 75B1 [Hibiscus trionum]
MEVAPSWLLLSVAWLASLAFLSGIFIRWRCKQLKFPPGPKPWPIIGNLNLMGSLLHQSLHKLSQRYGPLMQLKFGSYPVLVAASAEMAKEFLKTHDQIFAARPPHAAGKYIAYNYSDVLWAPYGPHWRQGRKIYLNELFSSKRLESFEYIRVEEMRASVSLLYGLSGEPFVLVEQLTRLSLSNISRMVLGNKCFGVSGDDRLGSDSKVSLQELHEMINEFNILNGAFNIGDWIPWLAFLDLQGYVKRMKGLKEKLDRFLDLVFDEHKRRKEELGSDFVAQDMVDLLLQLADNPESDLDIKLTHDALRGLTLDAIAAATESTAVTVEWAISELIKQPQLIGKATEELDRVIGRERWVEEKDIPQLPYIDAIMKETMRKHPVAPLLAPHMAMEDCNVAGYDILKGTRVFVSSWSIGRDPSLWEQPEEFRPERFLGRNIDVKGRSFDLLPFGAGRRMCPGYNLGLKMILLSIANLLQAFNWELPDNTKVEDLSMEEAPGISAPRKFPLVAVVEPRLPLHLYEI